MKNIGFRWLLNFFRSDPSLECFQCAGQLILRTYIGATVLIAHGWPKLQGMLSGHPRFPLLVGKLGFPFPEFFSWLVVAAQIGASLPVIWGYGRGLWQSASGLPSPLVF